MKVLIIEDEKPAFENIVEELHAIEEDVQVVGICGSIAESVKWLGENKDPDLVLMDIQLSDGPSFCIFDVYPVTFPVIFITAYDKYLTEAFDYNSIDYLLKPINTIRLKSAIQKYKNLQNHFVNNHTALLGYLNNSGKKKSRIVVKRRSEYHTVKVEDIGYFFTDHKLIFLVDKENKKYLADKTNLAELESELDKTVFYRANRKYIINANFIKKFKSIGKSKITIELTLPVSGEIIISQENSSNFKRWISEM